MHTGKRPFLRLLVPLCSGIFLAETAPGGWIYACTIALVSFAALLLSSTDRTYKNGIMYGIFLFIFILSGGYLLNLAGKKRAGILDERQQYLLVKLHDYPEKKRNSYSASAKILASGCDTLSNKVRGSVMIYFLADSLPSSWLPGDRLLISTSPRPVTNNGNPCEFNYRRYMEGKGIRYYCLARQDDILNHTEAARRTIREHSAITAHKMILLFRNAGLQGNNLALVTALTLGEKSLLDRETLTSFSHAGAMHIMAVSGLHVGMISLFLSYLLFFLKRRLRVLKVIIVIILLWVFAFITGLSPSVLRATIMFSFLQTGRLLRRQTDSMNILFASAFILVTARPSVLFEAGFQLSYLAVGFIILFYTPLYNVFKIKNRIGRYLWQITALSVTAQAGTLPLAIRLFNIMPLLSPAVNIIVIPATFIILAMAMLLIPLSFAPAAGSVVAGILNILSGTVMKIITETASLRFCAIMNIGLTAAETVLLIVALTLLLTALLRVRKISLRPFMLAASVFLLCTLYKDHIENRKEAVITYNIKGEHITAYQSGRTLLLISPDGTVPPEVSRHASIRGLTIKVKAE